MSDHEYSQGIIGDGVAILKNGQPMTHEQIICELLASQERIKVQNEKLDNYALAQTDWRHKLNSCRYHDDDQDACATYSGQVPCDAESAGVPESWRKAAKGAIEFSEKGITAHYPETASAHIKGMAELLLSLPQSPSGKEGE